MVKCGEREEGTPKIEESLRIEYDGQKFILPEVIAFDKQSTFAKVE
jgi:hypothetical protein